MKKSVWLLSEVRLSPREVKPYGFVFFAAGQKNGGESEIRTHGRVTPTQHFQCCAFDHSAISPKKTNHYIMISGFCKLENNIFTKIQSFFQFYRGFSRKESVLFSNFFLTFAVSRIILMTKFLKFVKFAVFL